MFSGRQELRKTFSAPSQEEAVCHLFEDPCPSSVPPPLHLKSRLPCPSSESVTLLSAFLTSSSHGWHELWHVSAGKDNENNRSLGTERAWQGLCGGFRPGLGHRVLPCCHSPKVRRRATRDPGEGWREGLRGWAGRPAGGARLGSLCWKGKVSKSHLRSQRREVGCWTEGAALAPAYLQGESRLCCFSYFYIV